MPSSAGLAQVLAAFGPAYLASHTLTVTQAKAWRAILACRTPALGGHVERCDACGTIRHVHHSCRNRHCPQCQTRAKEAWLAQRRRELLPVPYFHLVFTLPHVLDGLIAARPRRLYEMLFAAASATLTEFAADPRHLGGEAAFTLVLHTWKQDLGRHVHVHALVAGGALAPDGNWRSPKKGFLFPVKALSRVFRGKFVAALGQQRSAFPSLASDLAWRQLGTALFAHDWVVYAKQPLGGPEPVLDYLGRYTHRVAISNERIVAVEANTVAFRVRADDTGKRRTLHLAGSEFVRRFLLHVLPTGFKRIRHYGLLAPSRKTQRLAAARAALGLPATDPAVVESVTDFMRRVARVDIAACPCCGSGRMVTIAPLPPLPPRRPSPAAPRAPP